MFGKTKSQFRAAGGWLRKPGQIFSKSRKFADGALISLMIPADVDLIALRAAAYENLQKIQDQMGKAAGACCIAIAFGLLVYENALSGFSTAGMEIEKLSFAHVALVGMSVTFLWVRTHVTRASYITSWFHSQFEASAADHRTLLLLKYPAAFWYFQFMRGNRGYPRFIFPHRNSYAQLFPIVLIVLSVLLVTIGIGSLWLAIAIEVWRAAFPSVIASKATVVASSFITLLAVLAPSFGGLKRRYNHYGLSDVISGFDEPKKRAAYLRINRAAVRVGLVEPPQGN